MRKHVFGPVFTVLVLAILASGVPWLGSPPATAGPFSWLAELIPEPPKPEDPHLYPEGSMLYDIWTCKGESEIGWVGVTQQFTDHDPYIVVVARTEFAEQLKFDMQVGIEIHAPRHNRIVASDRVHLRRNQDVAIFYNPQRLARLGGWGEYKAVLVLDGWPRDVIAFRMDKQEILDALRREEEERERAQEAFKQQFEEPEAKSLLGEPDIGGKSSAENSGEEAIAEEAEPVAQMPVEEVWQPEEWYRTTFNDEQGRVIVFPKKARKTWRENVIQDLKFRIEYYVYE